jgi:hypothetical protein
MGYSSEALDQRRVSGDLAPREDLAAPLFPMRIAALRDVT